MKDTNQKGAVAANAKVSVVIATRNRADDLLRAVGSVFDQSYENVEVLVFDDCSDDDTSSHLEKSFPRTKVFRRSEQCGYIVLRNEGFRRADGEIVISLDDDAYFSGRETIGEVVEIFRRNERLGALALQYVEPKTERERARMRMVSDGAAVRGYVGCAHAIRRDVALALGGYRELYFHQGEERDLAIRMRHHGYEIRFARTTPIVHTYSPKRDRAVMSYYGVRNTLLFDLFNIPQPYVFPRMCLDAASLFRYKLRMSTAISRARLVASAFLECVRFRRLRRPVSIQVYREHRRLPAHGPVFAESTLKSRLSLPQAVE